MSIEAALITGRETVEILEFPDPSPTDGRAVVEIARCGICGTDVHAFASGRPYTPAVCGHEWVGTVSAVDPAVDVVAEGDRVMGGTVPACGRCDACRAGQTYWCQTAFAVVTGRDALAPPHGGFAPALAVDARRLVPVPDTLDDDQGAMVEPTSIAVHAVRKAGPRLGDLVVVLGAGPIGLLTAMVARVAGAGALVVVEPNDARRSLAAAVGADHSVGPGEEADQLVRELTNGLGADLVYECAGVTATVPAAARLARRGGKVVLVGVAEGTAEIAPAAWVVQELQVDAAIAATHDDFGVAIGLMADGRLDVAPLHDGDTGLSGLADALADLASGTSARTKVIVDPRA